MSAVAFPAATSGPTLDAATMGALVSVVVAPLAVVAARLLSVKRVPVAGPSTPA